MKILYIGDIMGEPGLTVLEKVLPKLRAERQIDIVLAQAENTTLGKGISILDFAKLRKIGVDFCTGGNWSLHNSEIYNALNDPDEPIIRPANYPVGTPGLAYKILKHSTGSVLIVSLLGSIVGKDANKLIDNPLKIIDSILQETKNKNFIAKIINFHGDFSSEKRVIGYYLDGRVTAVVGDHWHVPTADAMVLPKGTAHITDVGMCGSLHSSLGVKTEIIISRWRDGLVNRNQLETNPPFQFNSVLIDSDNKTALANSITPIQIVLD